MINSTELNFRPRSTHDKTADRGKLNQPLTTASTTACSSNYTDTHTYSLSRTESPATTQDRGKGGKKEKKLKKPKRHLPRHTGWSDYSKGESNATSTHLTKRLARTISKELSVGGGGHGQSYRGKSQAGQGTIICECTQKPSEGRCPFFLFAPQ